VPCDLRLETFNPSFKIYDQAAHYSRYKFFLFTFPQFRWFNARLFRAAAEKYFLNFKANRKTLLFTGYFAAQMCQGLQKVKKYYFSPLTNRATAIKYVACFVSKNSKNSLKKR